MGAFVIKGGEIYDPAAQTYGSLSLPDYQDTPGKAF